MDDETLGMKIRMWLRDLFGSRLNAHLEEELMRLRADFETRLQERDRLISDLREEKAQLTAKVDRYEMVIIPMTSGSLLSQRKPLVTLDEKETGTDSLVGHWQAIQRNHDREQENSDGDDGGRQAQKQ